MDQLNYFDRLLKRDQQGKEVIIKWGSSSYGMSHSEWFNAPKQIDGAELSKWITAWINTHPESRI